MTYNDIISWHTMTLHHCMIPWRVIMISWQHCKRHDRCQYDITTSSTITPLYLNSSVNMTSLQNIIANIIDHCMTMWHHCVTLWQSTSRCWSHLGERVDGEGWKSVEVRIVEAACRVGGVAGGDGEDLVRRLGGPVRTGEREPIVRPSV